MTHSLAASGQVMAKVSPTKRPKLVPRRAATDDFELLCPDKVDTSAKLPQPAKRPGTFSKPNPAKKGRSVSLLTHTIANRIQRVTDLVEAKEATPGFFVEVFPNKDQVQHATERWFFQVTKSEIVNNSVRGNWCNADCLTIANQAEESLHLGRTMGNALFSYRSDFTGNALSSFQSSYK
jgi:hypothetical protein